MARKVLVSFLTLAFVLVGGLALERGARAAEMGVKVGILSCNVSSGAVPSVHSNFAPEPVVGLHVSNAIMFPNVPGVKSPIIPARVGAITNTGWMFNSVNSPNLELE